MIQELHQVLKNKEVRMYLQPIFNDKFETVGFELLSRWEQSSYSPIELFSIFKYNGMEIELERYITSMFLSYIESKNVYWSSGCYISINVTESVLNDIICIENLIKISKYIKLTVEVSELYRINNVARFKYYIDYLRNNNVRIALDDFGVEFSNLNLLLDFDVDIIKIDRILIENVIYNKKAMSIVSHLLKLSLELNIEVISEGVENIAQFLVLREIGIRGFQGYLYSKAEKIEFFEF
ncbi:TPA: EAL domain-containing protein [Photobacterium damselae]